MRKFAVVSFTCLAFLVVLHCTPADRATAAGVANDALHVADHACKVYLDLRAVDAGED